MRFRFIWHLTLFLAWYAAVGKNAVASEPPKFIRSHLEIELILLPQGEFQMGSPNDEVGRQPEDESQHRVEISRQFYLGRYEVQKRDFAMFVSETGYVTDAERNGKGGQGLINNSVKKSGYSWQYTEFPYEDDHPVVNISWNDAVAFCNWLSRKDGKPEHYDVRDGEFIPANNSGYRLPTEAEWEYACRAGTTTAYSNGNDPDRVAEIANHADLAYSERFGVTRWTGRSRDAYIFTAPVGQRAANAFGLYDMHGNVWEWCEDTYIYPADHPMRKMKGNFLPLPECRIYRGGGWRSGPWSVRSATREMLVPAACHKDLGFRIAKDAGDDPPKTNH